LPRSHEDSIISFSRIAGVEHTGSLKKSGMYVPGCYRIWGLGYPDEYCYVGQAKHLGRRVKYHSKGSNKSTKTFCNELGNNAKVDLFIIPKENEIIIKFSLEKFLCILEQFLIFKYRPLINKIFIATPGIILDQKAIKKQREKVGKKIYIYLKSKEFNILELIYISPCRSYISKLLGYERSWVKNTLNRSCGWYKDKLYFSNNYLENLIIGDVKYGVINNLKDENIIKEYL
jgi:GIY-YIG catalytic domain